MIASDQKKRLLSSKTSGRIRTRKIPPFLLLFSLPSGRDFFRLLMEAIPGEIYTAERFAKGDVRVLFGNRGGFEIFSISDPVYQYHNKGSITNKQFAAAKRYYSLWYCGCAASGYVQVQYRESTGGEREAFIPGAFAHEYRSAMKAVRGVKERRVLYQIVCEGKHLVDLIGFTSTRTAQRQGMIYLRSALDDLHEHFKR